MHCWGATNTNHGNVKIMILFESRCPALLALDGSFFLIYFLKKCRYYYYCSYCQLVYLIFRHMQLEEAWFFVEIKL